MIKEFTDLELKKSLLKLGLNPEESSFLNDPRYHKIKNNKIFMGHLGFVTYDYYIRKNWFKNIQSRFDMGAKKDNKPVTLTQLIDELCDETEDPENIRQKLIGNTSGIRHNLKHKIQFDLNAYSDKQNLGKFKILKLLYCIEKKEKKINLTSLLSYLSLENVDKSIIGETSAHGKVLTELLTELQFELDESFPKEVQDYLVSIVSDWNAKLLDVANILYMPHAKYIRVMELNRIKKYLINLKNRLPIPQISSETKVVEAFYIRILQLKQLCRIEDITRVNNFILQSTQTKHLLNNYQFNPNFNDEAITDLDSFLAQYVEKVAKIVYQKDSVTKKELDTVIKWSQYVPLLLNSYHKQVHSEQKQSLSLLFLISCLQEILLSKSLKKEDDEYEFKNDYYRSNRKANTLYPTLRKINKNLSVEEALELVWIKKIERRMHANLGRLDEYILTEDIGNLVNELIKIIAKLPDLQTMLCWHNFLLSQLIVAKNAPILNYAGIFDEIIKQETGYVCKIKSMRIFQYFDIEPFAKWITDLFLQLIKNDKSNDREEKKRIDIFINNQEFIIIYSLDINNKILNLYNFIQIKSEDEIIKMQNSGLAKFLNDDAELIKSI